MTSCCSEPVILRQASLCRGVGGVPASGLSGPLVARAKACMKPHPVTATGWTWGMAARDENRRSG